MSNFYNILSVDRIEDNINDAARDTFGVFVCNSGEAEVAIGDKIYKIERDVLFFFTPYTIARVKRKSPDFAGLLLEEGMDALFTTISGIPMRRRALIQDFPCIRISLAQRERIEEMISVINRRESLLATCCDERDTELLGRVLSTLIQAFCFEVIEIYFACSQVSDIPQTKETKVYSRFMSSVFRNCDSQRSVSFYASEQHLSPGHFTVTVRNASGLTPLKWIETLVMSRAKKYLSDNSLSMKEIAAKMHFPDQSAFGRYFRSHEGISPSRYRFQLRTGSR